MKILLLTEAAATGVGRHVCDLADGLTVRGHAVHLLYSPLRMDAAFASRVDTRRYIAEPVRIPHLAAIASVRRYIRTNGPFDVIHCHSSKAGLTGRLAAIGTGAAVLYTPHALATMDPGWPAPVRAAVRVCEKTLARLTDAIVAVSEEERRHALSLGIVPKRVEVIPNGIARPAIDGSARQRQRQQWSIPGHGVCIGTVGRLTRQKNVELLLRAAAEVLRTRPGSVLAVVGDGPLRRDLQSLATALGIAKSVRWLGAIDGPQAMAAFDIFALTSRYEGFPYVFLEAMAAGLPIVTTAVGGARALIAHQASGFIVPPDSIATHLALLADDPSLRLAMGASASARVAAFSLDRMVDATVAEYGRALRATARHPSALDVPVS